MVNNGELGDIVARCNQVIPLHFVDILLPCGEVVFRLELQRSSPSAIKIGNYRRNHLLYAKIKSLVGSELEIYIIFLQYIQEHASKLLFLLCTSSKSPSLISDRGTSWTVEIQVERHICLSRTSILKHKVKLLVAVYLG